MALNAPAAAANGTVSNLRQATLRPNPVNLPEHHIPLLLSQARLAHANALRLSNRATVKLDSSCVLKADTLFVLNTRNTEVDAEVNDP